ncbi:diacylglycerol kinase family lipid kinase [Lactobacillus sp. XV13L]|nr:diacylglycerol kinase family lipid kinase [Lactobacillus sp. XV13L]
MTTDPRVLLGHLKANLEPVEVDCGTFRLPGFSQNTFYFANSFGMGFDAYVNHLSNISQLKKVLNKINEGNFIYGLHILTCLRKQDTFKVEIESRGKTKIYQDAFLVTTTNHPYLGGGIPLLPVASINSHKLDTVIVEKFTLRGLIKLFVKLLRDGSHVGCPEFHYVEAEQIRVKTTKKEFAQVDGEEIKRSRFDVEVTVDQVNLLR